MYEHNKNIFSFRNKRNTTAAIEGQTKISSNSISETSEKDYEREFEFNV